MEKKYNFVQFDNNFYICYNRQCASKKGQRMKYRRIIVKNILKRIIIFSIVLLLSISNFNYFGVVNALKSITIPQKNKTVEIYEIEEVSRSIDSIIEYYKTDPNKEEFLAYKAEQERLEQERLEQERLEQERLQLKSMIVNFSLQFVGNPYVMGGNSLTNGTDCSGFVQLVYGSFGMYLPRTTTGQAVSGTEVSIDNIEIGDIVSYGYDGYVSHSALYIGDGMIVHASTPELGIRTDNLYMMPIITIRRVV